MRQERERHSSLDVHDTNLRFEVWMDECVFHFVERIFFFIRPFLFFILKQNSGNSRRIREQLIENWPSTEAMRRYRWRARFSGRCDGCFGASEEEQWCLDGTRDVRFVLGFALCSSCSVGALSVLGIS